MTAIHNQGLTAMQDPQWAQAGTFNTAPSVAPSVNPEDISPNVNPLSPKKIKVEQLHQKICSELKNVQSKNAKDHKWFAISKDNQLILQDRPQNILSKLVERIRRIIFKKTFLEERKNLESKICELATDIDSFIKHAENEQQDQFLKTYKIALIHLYTTASKLQEKGSFSRTNIEKRKFYEKYVVTSNTHNKITAKASFEIVGLPFGETTTEIKNTNPNPYACPSIRQTNPFDRTPTTTLTSKLERKYRVEVVNTQRNELSFNSTATYTWTLQENGELVYTECQSEQGSMTFINKTKKQIEFTLNGRDADNQKITETFEIASDNQYRITENHFKPSTYLEVECKRIFKHAKSISLESNRTSYQIMISNDNISTISPTIIHEHNTKNIPLDKQNFYQLVIGKDGKGEWEMLPPSELHPAFDFFLMNQSNHLVKIQLRYKCRAAEANNRIKKLPFSIKEYVLKPNETEIIAGLDLLQTEGGISDAMIENNLNTLMKTKITYTT